MHRRIARSPKNAGLGMEALRRFSADEAGAAYTLSYVMVIPLYALLMCLIVETAMMLTAKLGTVYAGYAAARSATVWASATTWSKAQDKARFAAIKTMTPFASGTQPLVESVDPQKLPEALFFRLAYGRFAKDPVKTEYLMKKFGYAARNMTVEIEGPPKKSDSDITVKITYDFPFNVPGIGRLIGRKKLLGGGYYYPLATEVTLPNEGPRDDRKTIGIGYGTLE